MENKKKKLKNVISVVQMQLVFVFSAQFIFAIIVINLYIIWKKMKNIRKKI